VLLLAFKLGNHGPPLGINCIEIEVLNVLHVVAGTLPLGLLLVRPNEGEGASHGSRRADGRRFTFTEVVLASIEVVRVRAVGLLTEITLLAAGVALVARVVAAVAGAPRDPLLVAPVHLVDTSEELVHG
jgi:hypothetical protein